MPENKGKHQCQRCLYKFSTKSNLTRHQNQNACHPPNADQNFYITRVDDNEPIVQKDPILQMLGHEPPPPVLRPKPVMRPIYIADDPIESEDESQSSDQPQNEISHREMTI